MLEIKICGVKDENTASVAIDAGATHVGIVGGAPDSPRHVDAATATSLVKFLHDKARSVLVARALTPTFIKLAARAGPDLVQVHDHNTFHLLRDLRGACSSAIMFGIQPGMLGEVVSKIQEHFTRGDTILVDGSLGTGTRIDDQTLATTMERLRDALGLTLKDVFVAGGLSPENISSFLQDHSPRGVDASSALESAPGVKDPARIRQFCIMAKNAKIQHE